MENLSKDTILNRLDGGRRNSSRIEVSVKVIPSGN